MMVVGIDSYHDSSKKGRSVGGVVASTNQALTRYYSRCTFQHSMQELMDGLKVCMKGLLIIHFENQYRNGHAFMELNMIKVSLKWKGVDRAETLGRIC